MHSRAQVRCELQTSKMEAERTFGELTSCKSRAADIDSALAKAENDKADQGATISEQKATL